MVGWERVLEVEGLVFVKVWGYEVVWVLGSYLERLCGCSGFGKRVDSGGY